MPALSKSSALGNSALTRSVRLSGSIRLSMALTWPVKVRPGKALAVASTSPPILIDPEKRSGTWKSIRIFDRSSIVAICVWDVT